MRAELRRLSAENRIRLAIEVIALLARRGLMTDADMAMLIKIDNVWSNTDER